MARRRNRLSPGYLGRTKGHSILPQRSYGYSSRSSRYQSDEDYPVPGTYRPSTTFYPGADYFVADAMTSQAEAFSTNTVYDNIDLAEKSRGKDKRLMTQVNAALAYASPSTPARARASRRANRERPPVKATSAQQTYSAAPVNSVPYQVPIYQIPMIPLLSPPESKIGNTPVYRYRSVSPTIPYMYWRPIGGRAKARASRRDLSVERADPFAPVDIERDTRSRSLSPLPRGFSLPREAELAFSPTRLDRSGSWGAEDYPYARGLYSWYPRAAWRSGNRARRFGFPIRRSRWSGYPYSGSRWGGYPFGPTRWIVSPKTASRLGVLPVRASRWEDVEPRPVGSWFTSPDILSAWDISPARLNKWNLLGAYDPHWDITPAEATRFGIEPSVAAKWNAASPIRTGRWDPIPSETGVWDDIGPLDDTFRKSLQSLREGSPVRSDSPTRGDIMSLSPSEAARWGIRPDEAVAWGFYPASRTVSPLRFERARSVSPYLFERALSVPPMRYERARSLSPWRYDWGLTPGEESRWGLAPGFRSRSLSPSAGRNWFVSPYEESKWTPYPMKPRDLSPLRFVPLPLRSYARTYVPPRMGKKAIAPSKAARRAAARKMGYYPRPPISFYRPSGESSYFDQRMAGKKTHTREPEAEEIKSRPRPGHVALVRDMFLPRKPYETAYSGKVAAARAIARAMGVIPQEAPKYIVYPQEAEYVKAAIISPSVEIETKRKKEPKSKYAAAVMREMRLNPKKKAI